MRSDVWSFEEIERKFASKNERTIVARQCKLSAVEVSRFARCWASEVALWEKKLNAFREMAGVGGQIEPPSARAESGRGEARSYPAASH